MCKRTHSKKLPPTHIEGSLLLAVYNVLVHDCVIDVNAFLHCISRDIHGSTQLKPFDVEHTLIMCLV